MNALTERDDGELWKRAKEDRRAFGELFRRYAPLVRRAVWSYSGGSEDEAWDLVQETFLKALTHPDAYSNRGSLRSWLIAVARNEALDRWRKRSRMIDGEGPEPVDNDAESRILDRERARRLAAVMEELSESERELLRLAVEEEFSHAEIADAMGKREGAVRVALHRLRSKLSARMEKET